ncbi:MAG: HEPN family nuclease [Thermoguttaceae bacterium]|jgi:hypothetical protein
MEYDESQIEKDFAERTWRNLQYIRGAPQEQKEQRLANEFTQMINSMLGLLVFLKERFFRSIPETRLCDLEAEGLPKIKVMPESSETVDTFRELVRHLRNAVAHFNVEFLVEAHQLWGVRVKNQAKTWIAELSSQQLEKITELLFRQLFGTEPPACP